MLIPYFVVDIPVKQSIHSIVTPRKKRSLYILLLNIDTDTLAVDYFTNLLHCVFR